MLWYKAWLELRWRFLLPLAGTFVAAWWLIGLRVDSPTRYTINFLSLFIWPMVAVTQAGAGINTQVTYGARAGVHASMLFTLSLPVRRRRLVAVRAGLGALLTAVLVTCQCFFGWAVAPALRARLTPADVALYAICALAGSLVFYALGVLLSAMVDELWVFYGSFLALFAVVVLQMKVKPFASIDIFRVMGDLSYPMTGRMPWDMLAACAAVTLALVAVAVAIVERKEY